eukprot:1188848-Prorocentrum_minimum.AAC.1
MMWPPTSVISTARAGGGGPVTPPLGGILTARAHARRGGWPDTPAGDGLLTAGAHAGHATDTTTLTQCYCRWRMA